MYARASSDEKVAVLILFSQWRLQISFTPNLFVLVFPPSPYIGFLRCYTFTHVYFFHVSGTRLRIMGLYWSTLFGELVRRLASGCRHSELGDFFICSRIEGLLWSASCLAWSRPASRHEVV